MRKDRETPVKKATFGNPSWQANGFFRTAGYGRWTLIPEMKKERVI